MKPDTVEISAKDKIESPQKKGMSTGAKWTLGVLGGAATIYGCVVGHRALNKPSLAKVAKNFSEIFRRDISKEEAQKLAEKYKEIFSIKDKDEFCKKIYEQIKKDYGYENANIPLLFENLGGVNNNGLMVQAHWNMFNANIAINTELLKTYGEKLNKKAQQHITNCFLHEFQHVKQAEYAFRTNADKYLDDLCFDIKSPELLLDCLTNYKKDMSVQLLESSVNFKTKEQVESFIDKAIIKLKDGSYKSDNLIVDVIADLKNGRQRPVKSIFDKLEKFKPDSKEYKQGLSYLKCNETYNNQNMEIYDNAIIEKEAFATADKIENMYNYISSIWSL